MRRNLRWWVGVLAVLGCLATELAFAAAGRILYVKGSVEVRRAGSAIVAQRGMDVEVKDEIVVGPQGRAQLRMADGALIALQPSSTLVVDQFMFAAAPAQEQSAIGSSVLKLLKGGLRTITGLIGKRTGDNYQLNTTVATIGVRGTDYRIALCQGDCGATPDGLYLGVTEGAIVVSNGAGQLVLGNDEYAFVGGSNSAPQRLLQPPQVLETVLGGGGGPPEGQYAGIDGPTDDDDCHCTVGESDPGYRDVSNPDRLLAGEGELAVAHSTSSPAVAPVSVGASIDPTPPATFNNADQLLAFQALSGNGVSTFQIGEGSISNVGFDPATQMRWGRWSESAIIDGVPVDLTNRDLHWIAGTQSEALFALPLSGSATYELVGNTNPTDNLGNVGVLGSAQLIANFTSQTVTNTLSLSINDHVWNASGTASLNGPIPLFGGNYSQVSVDGATSGSGSFAGFFVPPAPGQTLPEGAGISYNLSSGATTVSGAAAFGSRD